MAEAKRPGGFYYIDGVAVDANGVAIAGEPRQPRQPGEPPYPVRIVALSESEILALRGQEDSAAYAIAVASEERAKRQPPGPYISPMSLRAQKLRRDQQRASAQWFSPLQRTNSVTLRSRLDEEQRGVINRNAQLTPYQRVRVIRRYNSGPDSIPLVRDGQREPHHYHDDGGTVERRVPSFMFRQARTV